MKNFNSENFTIFLSEITVVFDRTEITEKDWLFTESEEFLKNLNPKPSSISFDFKHLRAELTKEVIVELLKIKAVCKDLKIRFHISRVTPEHISIFKKYNYYSSFFK